MTKIHLPGALTATQAHELNRFVLKGWLTLATAIYRAHYNMLTDWVQS